MSSDQPTYSVNQVVEAIDSLHGQDVRIEGILTLEFEGDSLWHFPRSETSRLDFHRSSLWITCDSAPTRERAEALRGRRVVVLAAVDREETGHMGLWPGGLNIKTIEKWKLS